MSKKKTEFVERLIAEVAPRHPYPKAPLEKASLLEQGAFLVLLRHMPESQAEASVRALQAAFQDWNELRVSQAQEIASHLKTSSRKKGTELLNEHRGIALALRDYLQDVYQQTHHMDLAELVEDETVAGKTAASLEVLGMTGAAYLMWVGGEGRIPVHLPLVRFLDRLGFVSRTASLKKAREAIEPMVPKGQELAFTIAIHEALERWDDPVDPIFESVPVLRSTAVGKKAIKDRQAALVKAEAQRKRDEERRRKDDAKAEREAERERKKAELEAQRAAREAERRAAREAVAAAKKAEIERKAAEKVAEKKRLAAEKKAAAEAKKAADKKRAADLKKEAAKKKAAEKKAAAKKRAAAKKAASKKAGKKAATKKPVTKRPITKRPVTKRPMTRKPSGKKPVTKRPSAKKPVTKKKGAAPSGAKKAARPATKRPTTKKKGAPGDKGHAGSITKRGARAH